MSVTQEEHRGWEINDDYSQHPLDDADWEIDQYDEPAYYHWPILAAIFAAIVLLGMHFEATYVRPPIVNFPQPSPPVFIQQVAFPKGLRVLDCIHYDVPKGIMRPNWDNPLCTAEQSKKRIEKLDRGVQR